MQADAVNGEQVAFECCRPADTGPRSRGNLLVLASQVCNRESFRVKGDREVIVGRVWRNASSLFALESFNLGSRLFQSTLISAGNIPAEVKDVWHADENCQKADEQYFWDVRTNHTHSFAVEQCRS